MTFINRERELRALERFWHPREAQLIIIYGKRRIGKTEIIKQFIRTRPHIYFLAQTINEHENLRLLGQGVGEFFHDDTLRRVGFDNWTLLFEYLQRHAKKKFVLVIDEFPYLAEANKAISSIFQKGWDEHLRHTPARLILCGSSISMMEEETLSHKAPLYGRRTGQIFVKPLSFSAASKFYPGFSFARCLEFYSIAGGNPSYLKQFSPSHSLEKNMEQHLMTPEAFLYNEVEFLLREELREPRNYFAILKAIALSKNRVSEIANETGLPKGVLHKYLFTLEDLHIIHKEVPVTEKHPLKSRKGIYRLQDQYFTFWFRYILPNRGSIEEGRVDLVLRKIAADFNLTVAENYEKVSREILARHQEKFFPFTTIGRWWDKHEEIDIVAINEEEKKILFGEVKWSTRPVGEDIFVRLKEKARKVEWNMGKRNEFFSLFSRSGFTEAMTKIARKEGVLLFYHDKLL